MSPDTQRFQDLAAFRLPPGFRGRPGWVVLLWWLVQATLFGLSPQPLYAWRNALLRAFGARIAPGVRIRPSARVQFPWRLEVGARAWVGDRATLYNLGPIRIGADAVVSQNAYLCAGTHDMTRPDFPILAPPVTVEDEAWVASDAFVGPGVTIGRGAVLGARSTALKDVPAGMVAWGHPAQPRRPRRP